MRNRDKKIHVVLGFHVNYNHSYRTDRNDDSGFGYDTVVIRGIIDTLDKLNAKGLDARGTWEFDHYWSVQCCLEKYAPDILDDIARRVRSGIDEVIIDNWNNGAMSAMTREELRLSISRAISNEWGSGAKDRFGAFSPVVRSQEVMFTHGNIETLTECGIKAVAMYYSGIPFDGIRNFVPRLTPNERYNPLNLVCPVTGQDFIIVPMYNQGDVTDHLSLEMWIREVRAQQLSGKIPGNALIYVNMDADAKIWTGMGLPSYLNWIPNVSGIEEYIKTVNKFEYCQFGKLGDYIENNPVAGEVRIDMDTADGSHTGYSSWTEKWINYPLWTLQQKARRLERLSAALLEKGLASGDEAQEIKDLLYGTGLSNLECRLLNASTTHYGLASPMICPDRLRVAYHYADVAHSKAGEALDKLLAKIDSSSQEQQPAAALTLISFNKYAGEKPPHADSLQTALIKLAPEYTVSPLALRMKDESGAEVPFDMIPADAGESIVVFNPPQSAEPVRRFSIVKEKENALSGSIIATNEVLSNGLVTVRIGKNGVVENLQFRGADFAEKSLFNPGVTYRVDGKDIWYSPSSYRVRPHIGARGRCGAIDISYEFRIGRPGADNRVSGNYHLTVFEGLPYLYISGSMTLPQTPCTKDDIGFATRISTRFDPDWREVIPFGIRPGFTGAKGKYIKVWKHNFLDVTHAYELKFGDYDAANKDIDSLNNHITDGWVAFSDSERGLLFAHDQTVSSTFAMCPIRVREKKGVQKVQLNPFGAYAGGQLSHMPDGSGTARELMMAAVPSIETTAPSYNGRRVTYNVMLAPYFGDEPPAEMQRDAAVFSMPQAIFTTEGGSLLPAPRPQDELCVIDFDYRKDLELDGTDEWTYNEFLDDANSKPSGIGAEGKGHGIPKLPPDIMAKVALDTVRALLKIKI